MKVGRNARMKLSPLRMMANSGRCRVTLEQNVKRVAPVRDAIRPDRKLIVNANRESNAIQQS